MQDATYFLAQRGIELEDYLDPRRPALLERECSVRVNYETYVFASPQTAERFRQNVVEYCGLVTDPVSKRRFRPTPGTPQEEHDGVLFLFQNHGNRQRFAANPKTFALPMQTM